MALNEDNSSTLSILFCFSLEKASQVDPLEKKDFIFTDRPGRSNKMSLNLRSVLNYVKFNHVYLK